MRHRPRKIIDCTKPTTTDALRDIVRRLHRQGQIVAAGHVAKAIEHLNQEINFMKEQQQ